MPAALQIQDPRERRLVTMADIVLTPLGWLPARTRTIRRILLLRLERIGDLLMTLDAIDDVRRRWPEAEIDLAVGSWNESIAACLAVPARVHIADVPWLSRGERPTSWRALLGAARVWRRHRYDMVVNFEPDIRSNMLAWLTRAPIRVGYASGGGGALLTRVGTYNPGRHVAENARRLIAHAAGTTDLPQATTHPRLTPPADRLERVASLIGSAPRPLVGIHVSGGRASKQWHLDRFAAVARTIASATSGTIVLTGGSADREMVDRVVEQLDGCSVIDAAGQLDLPETAALLSRLDLFISSDTGPMHLAAAVGTPVVALFGPSDPTRYGPNAARQRILRVQLPCSPCGQVRLPPVRCRDRVPECMDGITVDAVVDAAFDLLEIEPRAGRVAHL